MPLAKSFRPVANGRNTWANPGFFIVRWNDERNHLRASLVLCEASLGPGGCWDNSSIPDPLSVSLQPRQLSGRKGRGNATGNFTHIHGRADFTEQMPEAHVPPRDIYE